MDREGRNLQSMHGYILMTPTPGFKGRAFVSSGFSAEDLIFCVHTNQVRDRTEVSYLLSNWSLTSVNRAMLPQNDRTELLHFAPSNPQTICTSCALGRREKCFKNHKHLTDQFTVTKQSHIFWSLFIFPEHARKNQLWQ